MMCERNKRPYFSIFITLILVSLISVYPIKEAHAIRKNYPLSAGSNDGYTYLLVEPGNPPQFTSYFFDAEDHIVLLSNSSTVYNWFRFQNVDVPRGAFIVFARISVDPFEDSAAAPIIYRAQGFDEDNATAPTDYGDLMNRPKTSAYWEDDLTSFSLGFRQHIGVDSIVQEIVNRIGWEAGNSIVICSSAEINAFPIAIYSYEGGSFYSQGREPVLEIEYIAPTQAPTVTFTISPRLPKEGQVVFFDASGSTDPDGDITAYQWHFGDGVTGAGKTVNHMFTSAGSYYVELTVTDNEGLIHQMVKTINVTLARASLPEPTPEPAPEPAYNVTLILESSEGWFDDETGFWGSISPFPDTGAMVEITCVRKDDGQELPSDLITVNMGGIHSFTGKITWDEKWKGEWRVVASYEGSTSAPKFITVVPPRGCLIATATYGSELSPEVQFLRGFRDNFVLNTYAGQNFMTIFNAWYYSFSPEVASVISANNALRNIMKIFLYPLIGILHLASTIYYTFSFYSELAVVLSGLVASSLIGIIYTSPLLLMLDNIRKLKVHPKLLRTGSLLWGLSAFGILASEITHWSPLMMFSTEIFVLISMILATLSSVKYIKKHIYHLL